MSGETRRALWKPWAGHPDAAPAAPHIAQAIESTIAARTLDNHLAAAIEKFSATEKQESEPTMTTSSPGAHALTIKQVLEDHGKKLEQILQTQLQALMGDLDGQITTVVDGTDAVRRRVRSSTDDFKAILGQFTNDIG